MSKYRMRFSKEGRSVYISHLDLMHTLQRAFARSGVHLAYSNGFNPHPQISIAMPLSVGTSSECEYLDFSTAEDMIPENFVDCLNASVPEGIHAQSVYIPDSKISNIKWLRVSGRFEYDSLSVEDAVIALEQFYCQPEIIVSKKSKKSVSDVDIVPMIHSIEFCAGDSCVIVDAVVSASEPVLNPTILADALEQKNSSAIPDFFQFHRVEVYDADMQIFH